MTSGTRTDRRRAAPRRRALLLLAAAAVVPAAAAGFDLQALMRRLASRPSGQARFSEERFVSGIEGPLTSSGTLSFAAPDRFARHTEYPVRESMEIQGRTLLLRRGGRTRQMDIDVVPELGALLGALRATLTGDAQVLLANFRCTLSGSEAQWALRLVPLDARLAAQVRQVEIVGQGADPRSIELLLVGGDRSLMLIEPLAGAGTPAAAASR